MMQNNGVDRLVKLGLLAALSMLMMLIRFPLFLPFLEYDMADVPIIIGTFLYGPWWGLLLTAAVSVLQGLTISAGSGLIGILMHFFASGEFMVVAGSIYRRVHTFKGALLSLVCGSLTMILLMVPLNLVFTGYFMGTPIDVVKGLMWPAIIPFNVVKACINSVLTLLLYKSVGRVLKLEFVKPHEKAKAQTVEKTK